MSIIRRLDPNSERYRHENGVSFGEVDINAAGSDVTLHTVAKGKNCRVTELTIRHSGTSQTTVTLKVSGAAGTTKLTISVAPNSSIEWESVIGRIFTSEQVVSIQSSDITGGDTYVSGSGIEA